MLLRGWITTPTYPHGERWKRMKGMHFVCEATALVQQVRWRERREEELRDEHAGARMDDDGCPNDGRTSSGEANGMEGKSL